MFDKGTGLNGYLAMASAVGGGPFFLIRRLALLRVFVLLRVFILRVRVCVVIYNQVGKSQRVPFWIRRRRASPLRCEIRSYNKENDYP